MNSERMSKIVSFLKNKSLDDINNFLSVKEETIFTDIKRIESLAKSQNFDVNISVNKNYTFNSRLGRITGISGIEPSYKMELKEYTCAFTSLSHLWYKVRDTITDFYHYDNAEVNQNNMTVKMSAIHTKGYPEEGIEVLKEFKNGQVVYKLTEELFQRIEAVKWINSYFNGK